MGGNAQANALDAFAILKEADRIREAIAREGIPGAPKFFWGSYDEDGSLVAARLDKMHVPPGVSKVYGVFRSIPVMMAVVTWAIRKHANSIARFVLGGEDELRLNVTVSRELLTENPGMLTAMRVYEQDEGRRGERRTNTFLTNTFRLILAKDPESAAGFAVRKAFPIIMAPKEEEAYALRRYDACITGISPTPPVDVYTKQAAYRQSGPAGRTYHHYVNSGLEREHPLTYSPDGELAGFQIWDGEVGSLEQAIRLRMLMAPQMSLVEFGTATSGYQCLPLPKEKEEFLSRHQKELRLVQAMSNGHWERAVGYLERQFARQCPKPDSEREWIRGL